MMVRNAAGRVNSLLVALKITPIEGHKVEEVEGPPNRPPSRVRAPACATRTRVTSRRKSLYLDYGNRPQSELLRRRQHQGPQGPRRRAQTSRHVHWRYRRRLRPPPHGVRGFG